MDKEIRCDQDRIVQVLNNLISNAIKFSPNKSKIIVSCAADADNVIFSVRDSGSGIPKEKQGEIFTKFYQVDTRLARKAGGTGLGLVICKGIVEAHGGKIWFESEEGKGSLFSFSLSLN
jgi:signal transduction histidine kinase